MKLVNKQITTKELKMMSSRTFGGLIKCVVDIKKGIMIVDADMHADQEKFLLETGSKQDDLWGINLYPELPPSEFIEFDSMINVRPRLNNFSRGVENKKIRELIIKTVTKLVKR